MNRIALGIAVAAILPAMNVPAMAQISLETSTTSARQYIERGQLKRAETGLKKSIEQASAAGQQDIGVARAAVLLAKVYRQSGKFSESRGSLEQAHAIYKTLGSVEPEYADEFKALAGSFRTIDTTVLGASSGALKNNAAIITMAKTETGAHVEIKMDAPYQNSLNNGKLDGIQLEKLVTFELDQSTSPQIQVTNIKGFKIHSVEKNMWVNLLALKVGAVDNEGKYDTELTAGKAGITKTVPAKLPQKAYEPVLAIANQLSQFVSPVDLDLPVAVQPATNTPAVPAVSSGAATSTAPGADTPGVTPSVAPDLTPSASVPAAVPSSSSTAPAAPVAPYSVSPSPETVTPASMAPASPASSSSSNSVQEPGGLQTKRLGVIQVGPRPAFSPGSSNHSVTVIPESGVPSTPVPASSTPPVPVSSSVAVPLSPGSEAVSSPKALTGQSSETPQVTSKCHHENSAEREKSSRKDDDDDDDRENSGENKSQEHKKVAERSRIEKHGDDDSSERNQVVKTSSDNTRHRHHDDDDDDDDDDDKEKDKDKGKD